MNASRDLPATAILVFLVAVQPAVADMAIPGIKRVGHHVIFDNLDEYPGYVFFLVPTGRSGSEGPKERRAAAPPTRLQPGQTQALGGHVRFNFDWLLVAVPIRQFEAASVQFAWNGSDSASEGVLHSAAFTFPDYDDALVVSPTEEYVHRFRVEIAGGRLTATRTAVEIIRNPVLVFFWIAVSVAVVGLGLWWVRCRRAAPPAQVIG